MSYAIVPYSHGGSPKIYEGVIEDAPAPRRRRRKKRSTSASSAPAASAPKRRKAKKTSAKKKATRKKKRTPAQIAATKRMVAANKAKRGGKRPKKTAAKKRKTSQKSSRRSAPKRKKARRGPVGGAVRVRGSSGRAVTIVAPHKSAHSPCPSCGRYHDLRQHWSHKKGPHNYYTRTESSFSCARNGTCAPKTKKTKSGKRKNVTKRRQAVQKPMTRAQAQILAVRAKWNARAKGR